MMADRPVPPAARRLTVKEQREAQRIAKVEAFKRAQARRARNKRIGVIAAVGGSVLAAAAVAAVVISSIVPQGDGLRTFRNKADHVSGSVEYPQNPPAGGPHNPVWLNCGVYEQPVPNENAVHSLEHGAIWITYDPALPPEQVQRLREALPASYALLSPYPGLPAPVVVSAWNAQRTLTGADDPRLPEFVQRFWRSPAAPEPGAPCVGGLDAPGRVA